MITREALQEAIAEVIGKRSPNRDDCIMLAAFYIIQDRLYPALSEDDPGAGYSTASPPEITQENRAWSDFIDADESSDFLRAVQGKDLVLVMDVMDELMQTIKMIYPRLYGATMRALDDLR